MEQLEANCQGQGSYREHRRGVRGDEREGTDGICGLCPQGKGSKNREDIRGWIRLQCPQQGDVSSASRAALERGWVCQGHLGQVGQG